MAIAPFTKEKALTLQTAMKVRDLLEQWGYTVRMTRTKDVSVPLAKRVSFAKSVHGSIFVSLHYNHAPNKKAHGVEIFYYQKRNDAAQSKKLGQDILNSMLKNAKVVGRGVHAGDYHVIRENSMPAVLVEGGFFSNAQEAKKLSTPEYINKLSYSIAKGIDEYMQRA
jgi:N-acetylmuramoyl-L-alanine amidase